MNRVLFTVTLSGLLWAVIIAGVAAVWFSAGPM